MQQRWVFENVCYAQKTIRMSEHVICWETIRCVPNRNLASVVPPATKFWICMGRKRDRESLIPSRASCNRL